MFEAGQELALVLCLPLPSASYTQGFNFSDRDSRIARTRLAKPAPSLEQVRHVIQTMPSGDVIQLRDRALVAFILLTGARDGAVATFKLKHVDLTQDRVTQDAREVATKFGKTFMTAFLPVGDDVRKIVEEWVGYLATELHWGPDDPLFPATRVEGGTGGAFQAVGLERRHWATADPIRQVFRRAFPAAGLPYFSPHRLRDTFVVLGWELCRTPAEVKAWSKNLGHSDVLTTFTSYGDLSADQQAEIIRSLGRPRTTNIEALRLLEKVSESLRRTD